MNKQLLIKALCSYRKSKRECLKSNLKHGRTNIAQSNVIQIAEIESMIEELEVKSILMAV